MLRICAAALHHKVSPCTIPQGPIHALQSQYRCWRGRYGTSGSFRWCSGTRRWQQVNQNLCFALFLPSCLHCWLLQEHLSQVLGRAEVVKGCGMVVASQEQSLHRFAQILLQSHLQWTEALRAGHKSSDEAQPLPWHVCQCLLLYCLILSGAVPQPASQD